jgi:hypothetical protein
MNLARDNLRHTAWCARDHSCNGNEHRSQPFRADHPGLGSLVLTRVQTADGRQHAEVRISVPLAGADRTARRQLETVLTELYHLLRYFRHIGQRAA